MDAGPLAIAGADTALRFRHVLLSLFFFFSLPGLSEFACSWTRPPAGLGVDAARSFDGASSYLFLSSLMCSRASLSSCVHGHLPSSSCRRRRCAVLWVRFVVSFLLLWAPMPLLSTWPPAVVGADAALCFDGAPSSPFFFDVLPSLSEFACSWTWGL